MSLKLKNYGNNCYLNSSIQCLLSSYYVAKYLFNYKDDNTLMLELQHLTKKKYSQNKDVQNTLKLHKQLHSETNMFRLGEQEDAHELLVFLFDVLDTKSFDNIFKINYDYDLKCLDCEYKTTKNENINMISLSVEKCNNIAESFYNYINKETVDFNCEKCVGKKYTKKIKMDNFIFPECLILHLKRFSVQGNKIVKNKNPVSFSKKITFKKCKYLLRGVIVHVGVCGHGHYFYVSLKGKNEWVIYNDSFCGKIENIGQYKDTILKNGYIYIYDKEN